MFFLAACGDDSPSITEPLDESSSSVVKSSSSSKTKKSSSSSSAKSSSSKKTSSSSKKVEQSSSSTNCSSSSVASSSSVNRSSSSVASSASRSSSSCDSLIVDPSTVVVDSIIDSRDGKTYKTVKIGTQTWMAENLNYSTESSYCPNGAASNCSKYGRLYAWTVAMESCPSDWHLPSKAEFETLINAVGGHSVGGKILKSSSGWDNAIYGVCCNGVDSYGFSALPAGLRWWNSGFGHFSDFAIFWSSTVNDSGGVYILRLDHSADNAELTYNTIKSYGFSVRCVQD